MALVTASRISMHFGGPLLLDQVSLKIEPGAKIGLIGRNGTGKTTLLQLLAGRLDPSSGSVTRQRGANVAYQAQELKTLPGATVVQEMRRVFAAETEREQELRRLEADIATAPDEAVRAPLLRDYARLQQAQEVRGVYDIDRRIESMLTSLGLPESAWHQPLASFSGGERNIIGLARVLLSDPDLMLLDEPSNHLDMEGVEWFIDFVRRSDAAVLMVSHNRHLLDATAKEIWELRGRKVTSWPGNYSDFQRQKAEAQALQERQYKVQQRLIQRIEFQARRLKDMANAYDDPAQAKRAKAMLRRIERMEKVERPDRGQRGFRASLAGGGRHGRIALAVDGYSFAHGDRTLFEDASLEIEYGERVCLVGPNGSGKTTLFRSILDEGSWENPTLRLGKAVKVGEYRQLHDVLDHDATLEAWTMAATGLDRRQADDLLHRFLFSREDLERTIGTLSGGEKSRLQLARLVHDKVNFLLLDEPTNHLDIESCELLEEMLQAFDGTLFVISHDRYFLDKLVHRVVEVRDKQLVDHPQTFAEWWTSRHGADGRLRRGALEDRREEIEGKARARREFEERKARRREESRLRSRVRRLEERIGALEARLEDVRRRLESAYAAGGDPTEGNALSHDYDAIQSELAGLYGEWDEVAPLLDD
ncbi:MAG: ribosomal protection-like ABC-F family protein [Planctomycetota bacterium]|jgi:ATP-binding cassette subfamily F protein 3